MSLKKDLENYADKGMVSFHMPGHKGRLDPLDVTELPGLDDLYAPEGMIKDRMLDTHRITFKNIRNLCTGTVVMKC